MTVFTIVKGFYFVLIMTFYMADIAFFVNILKMQLENIIFLLDYCSTPLFMIKLIYQGGIDYVKMCFIFCWSRRNR